MILAVYITVWIMTGMIMRWPMIRTPQSGGVAIMLIIPSWLQTRRLDSPALISFRPNPR